MMWWDDSYMFGGGWMMVSILLLGLLLLIATSAVLISLVSGWRNATTHGTAAPRPPQTPSPPDARAILDTRYARGDIATDEYLDRLSHLGS